MSSVMPFLSHTYLKFSYILLLICVINIYCLDVLKKTNNDLTNLQLNHHVNATLNTSESTKVKWPNKRDVRDFQNQNRSIDGVI
ncbi:unnamed protein product [Heterobilharzia americana]|nr:unnamed protein product [Heterobilharzia americana]